MSARGLSFETFPLTAKYDPQWVRDNARGENTLCQAETLSRWLPLRAGMRVLDLGCGLATSSIFMAREFGVEVWAADQSVSPTDNRRRALAHGCEANVYPMQLDARRLPFAGEFFDAVIGIDSFLYFGTDEHYLPYLIPFLKPDGFIGIVDIAFTRELRSVADAPVYLQEAYAKDWSYVHTLQWWKRHWEKTGLVAIRHAEHLPESSALLREYVRERPTDQAEDSIMRASRSDHEGLISLFCLVAQKIGPLEPTH